MSAASVSTLGGVPLFGELHQYPGSRGRSRSAIPDQPVLRGRLYVFTQLRAHVQNDPSPLFLGEIEGIANRVTII
jgi:hypothetical protein